MFEQYWKLKRARDTGRAVGEISKNKGCMRLLFFGILAFVALTAITMILRKVAEMYNL